MKARRCICFVLLLLLSTTALAERTTFTNPILSTGNDPFFAMDADGTYYYVYTTAEKVRIVPTKDPTRIRDDMYKGVIAFQNDGSFPATGWWAPELHFIQGQWWIYVSVESPDGQRRVYALRCTGDTPLSPFELVGPVCSPDDNWAIDGTVLQYEDELYFLWAGLGQGIVGEAIFIAHMSNPYTIDSERVLLSFPELPWELLSGYINEGPIVLKAEKDLVHIVYSANNAVKDDYCLGLLTWRSERGDLLDPAAWNKYPYAFFTQAPKSYNPGHCCFIKSPDGTEDYVVYHASVKSLSGYAGRSVRMQKFTWNGDLPDFGVPATPGEKLPLPSGTKP